MAKRNGTAKWVKTCIALAVIVGSAVAAHTTAFNQIDANATAIVSAEELRKEEAATNDRRLSRIERLLVAIAQNLGIDVSILFNQ